MDNKGAERFGKIRDLLDRMSATGEMHRQAYIEVRDLDDVALFDEVDAIMHTLQKPEDFSHLSQVLSRLIRNTGEPLGAKLYLQLIKLAPNIHTVTFFLIEGAKSAKLRECREFVLSVIDDLSIAKGNTLSSALQYLGELGEESDVERIGELLIVNCYQICNPMWAAIALGEIGSPKAIPYLKESIERHYWERNQISVDTCSFSQMALEKCGAPRYIPE